MSTVSIQPVPTPTPLTQGLYDYMNEIHGKIALMAFNLFEQDGRVHGHDLDHWLKAEGEFLTLVPLEISENPTGLSVRAYVPGFQEKDLDVVAEPAHLFITGKAGKKSEDKSRKTSHSETSVKELFRSIPLPVEIDPERVNADLKDGVLEISMPKTKPAANVKVMAKAA